MSIVTIPIQSAQRAEKFVSQEIIYPVVNKFAFLVQFICHPKSVGSPAPCSRFTAKYLVRKIQEDESPKRKILEVGAGRGAITRHILPLLREGDEFHVVEICPKMAKEVEKIVDKSGKKHLVKIHTVAIENFKNQGRKFDHVISTLPLNTFKPKMVEDFYQQLDKKLISDQGDFSYVELLGIPTIRLMAQKLYSVIDKEPYCNFKAITDIKNKYLAGKKLEDDIIWRNIPPIRVTHGQKKA